ncbi:Conserved_hypothetical protein [Hexamita inflata]|uniref:Uncharacterized protein n=1 Tax=Hexamita inflata TaxID=28002 RepID=A0AA86PNK4_9EUKA|nr:Conserved hypothetical protein [Hexamita inflata]
MFNFKYIIYYDKEEKIIIPDWKYQEIINRKINLLELDKQKNVKHLQYSNINQSIIIDQNVNLLNLQTLCILKYDKTQFQVDLDLQNTNQTVLTLLIENYSIKDETALLNFQKLQNLILEGTDFKDFGLLLNFKLNYLQIKNNSMSIQDKRTVAQMFGLKQLYLNSCGFKEVHMFQELTQLRELTLKNSQLKNSDFVDCSFRLLQKLDVSYNELNSLDNLTLSPCLFELNVSHNKIGKLFYDDVSSNANIEVLDLSYNKLFDINQLTLFPSLKDLNLESNRLGEKRVQVLKTLQIQTLNLTNVLCRTLNCINTQSTTNIIMKSNLKEYNSTKAFQCQNLRIFKIYSDKIQNNQIKQLQIVNQNCKIGTHTQQYSYQNRLTRYLSRLFHQIKNQCDQKIFQQFLPQVNFQQAINQKHYGYQQKLKQDETTYRLLSINQTSLDKQNLRYQLCKRIQYLLNLVNQTGYE